MKKEVKAARTAAGSNIPAVKQVVELKDTDNDSKKKLEEMYAQDYKENLEHVRDAFFKVSIKGGYYRANGEVIGDGGKSFSGVILKSIPINSWYGVSFDQDNPTPPDCWSLGGIAPEVNCPSVQSKDCISCPHNKWGSAVRSDGKPSKGKACSNMRRLVIKVKGIDFPIILHFPPTAVKQFDQYLKSLCTLVPPTPIFGINSEFSFDISKSYPLPVVIAGERLSLSEYQEIRQYKESDIVKKAINAYVETGAEIDIVHEDEEQQDPDCDI